MRTINGGVIMSSRFKLAKRIEASMEDGKYYDFYLIVDGDMKRRYCYRALLKGYADFALLCLENKSRVKTNSMDLVLTNIDSHEIYIFHNHAGKGGYRLV